MTQNIWLFAIRDLQCVCTGLMLLLFFPFLFLVSIEPRKIHVFLSSSSSKYEMNVFRMVDGNVVEWN